MVPPWRDLKRSVLAGSRPPSALPTASLGRFAHTNAPHSGCTHAGPGRTRRFQGPSPQPTSHRERNHACRGGNAAQLKPLSGSNHRARSVRPGSHRITDAAPCRLDPATSAGSGTPARQRGSARTRVPEPQPRRCPARCSVRHPPPSRATHPAMRLMRAPHGGDGDEPAAPPPSGVASSTSGAAARLGGVLLLPPRPSRAASSARRDRHARLQTCFLIMRIES